MFSRLRWAAMAGALLVLAAGCAPRETLVTEVAQFTRYREKQAGFSPQELGWINANCPFGMPAKTWPFGETKIIARQDYVLEHSTRRKTPLWVCERVTAEQLKGPYDRKKLKPGEPFKPDPKLAQGKRAELADYRGHKDILDRGHMAPVGDETRDLTLMAETYFLSNMVPQDSKTNQGIWAKLEHLCREWAKARGEVFIITGGFVYDPAEEDEATADGLQTHKTIGANRVAVPTHVYKIVVAKAASGKYEAIAFVLENKHHPGLSIQGLGEKTHPVRWVEERTGLNFMPKLQDADSVETTTANTLWQSNN